MADIPEHRGLHGVVTDDPLSKLLLDLGNRIRYGMTEQDRMDLINRQAIPGIKDAAYPAAGTLPSGAPVSVYDPAAAERYGSAYLFAQRFPNLTGAAKVATDVSRNALNAVGFPGVGPERKELVNAENLGMERGAAVAPSLEDTLLGLLASAPIKRALP